MRSLTLLIAAIGLFTVSQPAAAQQRTSEPGWTTGVIKSEQTRRSEPEILLRPYRPLHFYGNTVRRMHYRGRALPNLRDMRNTVRNFRGRQNG